MSWTAATSTALAASRNWEAMASAWLWSMPAASSSRAAAPTNATAAISQFEQHSNSARMKFIKMEIPRLSRSTVELDEEADPADRRDVVKHFRLDDAGIVG